MAQSTILAAGTTAANSTDVVVTTTPVVLSVFPNDGVWNSNPQLMVQRKIGSNYQQYFDANGHAVCLCADRSEVHISMPGTYRVSRGAVPESCGVALDTTA